MLFGQALINDLAGSGRNSWKQILESSGFTVHVFLHGLGENEEIQSLYVQHVKDALEKIQ
jgi:sirohydrochlorin cobaltochelatase